MQTKFNNAIVLTGGIGSGKSTASRILKSLGYDVIDLDIISHNKLESSIDEIIKHFGKEILIENKIDRKKLADIVFSDKNKLSILENILHPQIRFEVYRQAKILESYNKIYFIDIPIFFEIREKQIKEKKKNTYDIDKILLIYAPKSMQIKRIMQRNNLSYNEALIRIENQIDIEKKKEKATFIIENTSDIETLKTNIEQLLNMLKSSY
ncbi:MAG: dephospho-CoA kinase [Helicobacteraceae bacterium]|nr:dephospho-CoA kinase [Helicobacteraceae bacterium]